MLEFNTQLTYQFVVFFAERWDAARVDARDLATHLSAQPISGQPYGIKFRGHPEVEQTIVVSSGGVLPETVERRRWLAGGVWRLDLTPGRVDLFFDARGYADTHDSTPSLAEIVQRVRAPLGRSGETLNTSINRAAVVMTGVANSPDLSPHISIANRFFNHEYIPKPEDKARDMLVRVNFREEWTIEDHPTPIVANRLETADVIMPDSLRWSWDANLAIDETKTILSASAVSSFFTRACQWIEKSHRTLEPRDGSLD